MSQWNMAAISIGCIIIMVSNQMENGTGLMVVATIFTGVCVARFFKELSVANKKAADKKDSNKNKK